VIFFFQAEDGIRDRPAVPSGHDRPHQPGGPLQPAGTAMRAISARLQQYELIKPVTGFTPLGPISHIEVQPVKQYETYCEPCVLGEEDFWSVYVRYDPAKNKQQFGGVD